MITGLPKKEIEEYEKLRRTIADAGWQKKYSSQFTFDQLYLARKKSQRDLWFLCYDILFPFNGNKFSKVPHESMCGFYVEKDPSKSFREFAQSYTGPHDRIMLVPRQARKSGIKIIDNVQWIICFPEVRIMTCTATTDLSTAFINQLTDYFTVKGKTERNPDTNRVVNGDPTLFQVLFPEHCITDTEANKGEYITPVRNDPGSNFGVTVPTAGVLSMSGTTSGWRCDILDFDDPVSDRNSETGTQLETLNNRIAMINELLMTGGFRHTVATRYHPQDPYGTLIANHNIPSMYGNSEQDGLKYMCRPCWWLKDHPDTYLQPDYNNGCPAEEDLEFFYPSGPSYKELKKKFKNPKIFFSQQLNDPQKSNFLSFTDELIKSCLIDHSALPKSGMVFAAWDLAASVNKGSDHTSGVVGLIDERREWWIIDVINGRFNFSERCQQIVKTISIHHPRRTGIENSMGAEDNYREQLDRTAKQYRIPLNIDWISLGAGTADAKYNRICILHPWMAEKRIHFLNTIPYVDEIIRQFKNVGLKHADDDIPDAMSRLVEQYTRYAAELNFAQPSTQDDKTRWKDLEEREFYNLIFRRGKYEAVEPVRVEPEEPPLSWALDDLSK